MVRFHVPECPERDVERLRAALGVSGPLAQVLVRRGFREPDGARAFLDADERHPVSRFAGLEHAAELILRHVRQGNRITIHGDYDVDGVCSTAVLVRALRRLGAAVDWHLPDRAEGYGLSASTVARLAERGTGLLITADCGITAVQEIAAARALGMDAIVSDHHKPRADGVLPDAPIVHPAIAGYPCPDLCAAAVAHKLAQATLEAAGRDPAELDEDADLLALATIADVVPLRGENRTLARQGLRALARTSKPGLRALMAVARVAPGSIDERAVGFGLAPRLNAAGRLYRADAALELILTEDAARAAQIADELDRANAERRHTEQRIRIEAEAQIAAQQAVRSGYVLAGEGWHPGVIGIVASRLVEQHRRPVVLLALEGSRGRGSGRSIEAFDLLGGLHACADHLTRFGGHAAAAGLELERSSVEEFASAFDAHAASVLSPQDTVPVERVDAIVAGEDLGMELAEELATLAPFGRGNPSVSLMIEDATLCDIRTMGEGRHARFEVRCGQARARAVAFGRGAALGVRDGEPALATFTLEINEYNGVTEPRLVLRHAQPACEAQPAPHVQPASPQPASHAQPAPLAQPVPDAQPAPQGATLKPCPTVAPAQSTLFPMEEPIVAAAAPS